nr:META and DUF4377 domain-containing protein [Sphingomonas sp. Y57]
MVSECRPGLTAIALIAALSASSAVAAARPATQSQAAARLATQHWDLVDWTGGQVPQGKRLRLDFDIGRGSFSTDTMCNRAGGAYRIRGASMRLGDGKGRLVSTMMACPEPAMTFERRYVASLSAVRSWRIEGDRLVLSTAKGERLTYRAVHKPAANAPRRLIYVSAETRPCHGVAPMTCLQIREKPGEPWQLHYDGIVDFEPQPGIEYRLRIIEEKVAHPPADGSSLRWTLDQVIEQRIVDR